MEMYEGIVTARAIRRFTDDPISHGEIEACLRAAAQAPSGGNIQPWQFLVVTDRKVLAALGELYRTAYERYEKALLAVMPPFDDPDDRASWKRTISSSRHLAAHLGEVPAVVVVLMPDLSLTLTDDDGDIDIGTPYASVYPAVQNLILAARSMGIGACLTTVHRVRQDDVRALLGIPDRFETVALVPLGRPAGRFGVARRKPVERVTHWERYGDKRPFGAAPPVFDES